MPDRPCRRCRLPITEGRPNRLYHPVCGSRYRQDNAMLRNRYISQHEPELWSYLKLSKVELARLTVGALKFLHPEARVAVFRRVGLTPIPPNRPKK